MIVLSVVLLMILLVTMDTVCLAVPNVTTTMIVLTAVTKTIVVYMNFNSYYMGLRHYNNKTVVYSCIATLHKWVSIVVVPERIAIEISIIYIAVWVYSI